MSNSTDKQVIVVQSGGPGCIGWAGILIAILIALAAVMLPAIEGAANAPGRPIPHMTIEPETLHVIPSAPVFAELPVDPRANCPAGAGWDQELNAGELPACWANLTREEQNAWLRAN
jgi:hypothetical protein